MSNRMFLVTVGYTLCYRTKEMGSFLELYLFMCYHSESKFKLTGWGDNNGKSQFQSRMVRDTG